MKTIQTLNLQGRSMEIITDEICNFSIIRENKEENRLKLEVTIDSMYIYSESARGKITPDLSGVIGKNFDMTLSITGKELDLSGAEAIKYEVANGEKRDLKSLFASTFPDVPGKPIKLGESWISHDTIRQKSERGKSTIILESENTLEDFETVDGRECIRIDADVKGSISGEIKVQEAVLKTIAKLEGTDKWYFAYKEGIFVKSTSKGTGKGSIEVSSPQKMIIPMERKYTIETVLLK